MALSRLLYSEVELHLPNAGFSKPRRWFTVPLPSSSTQKKISRKSEAAKEKRTEKIKSFLQSYMEKHPGLFPKTKEVQDAIGGSWYLVRDILSDMRDKMFSETNLDSKLKESTTQISPPSEQTNNNNMSSQIEENCPKLDQNYSQIEYEIEQIRPSIEEKGTRLDLDTCISDILTGKEKTINTLFYTPIQDQKHNQGLGGTKTKTHILSSVIEGLKSGPKDPKLDWLDKKESKNDTNGGLYSEEKGKNVSDFVSALHRLGGNNKGLDVNSTKLSERNREDFGGIQSFLDEIIKRDPFSVPNPEPNVGEDKFFLSNMKPTNEIFREKNKSDLVPTMTSAMDAELAVQDPDFPEKLLKYPSKSVVVRGLSDSVSFDQLRASLLNFGSISGLAMGQSGSSIYLEFEHEESKEKALEAAKIEISGRKLRIYWVYAQKTCVLRISNVSNGTPLFKIINICGSHGKIKKVVQRYETIFDARFDFSELHNILNILNRLNGLVVDNKQWVVEPSSFVPVEIVQSLWNSENGRKHIQDIFQSICVRIGVHKR